MREAFGAGERFGRAVGQRDLYREGSATALREVGVTVIDGSVVIEIELHHVAEHVA